MTNSVVSAEAKAENDLLQISPMSNHAIANALLPAALRRQCPHNEF